MRKVKARGMTNAPIWGICCVVSTVTFALPAFAYRTGEDSADLAGKGRVAWGVANIGFTLSSKDLPVALTRDTAEQVLSAALDAWSAPECSAAEPFFAGWTDMAAAPKDGVNTIVWTTTKDHDFASMSPGDTDVLYHGNGERWVIAEADIYLNADDYDWTSQDGKDTSAQAVLTHELGHALGLLHPCEPDGVDGAPDCARASSSDLQTTMYPFYSAAQSSLEDDDLAGLCYLYPVDQRCTAACDTDQVCIEGECRTNCGSELCKATEVCGAWGCVPEDGCLLPDCVGQPCAGPNSCGPLATCKDGICRGGVVDWGDACKVSTDCADGACIGAVCQPICQTEADCSGGQCLAADDGGWRGCVSSRAYPAGRRCSMGEDCRSGICIFTANPSVCTDECTTSDTCSDLWRCEAVEGRHVCVPLTFHPAGGCALAPPADGTSDGTHSALALVLGALLATQIRRRAR